ncbi:hypothetical protein HDV05_001423 [Chytridiales sp. JEL 0842]|nr:hypothetical protein HDV05_001423 [Chytridiales sp. JEL 0842]
MASSDDTAQKQAKGTTANDAAHTDERTQTKIQVATLRKSLPPHLFKKSLAKGLWYLAIDFTVIALCMSYYTIYTPTSLLTYFVYANVLGFFMWCLFVVGHECGHSTFSEYPLVNAIFGHISHGFLLVPFYPWAKSHAAHHAFHNHKSKDRSHIWFEEHDIGYAKMSRDSPILIPFMFTFIYLVMGITDGTHYFPWGKLNNTNKDRIETILSSSVCFLYLFAFLHFGGLKWFMNCYFYPWLVYNCWLYAVTYLQHHTEGTNVYSGSEWTFTKGAVETVDRVYDTLTPGAVLDDVMHNISNGHVVHHLFSTSIPHYNLMEATKIIAPQLGASYRKVVGFPLWELLKSHWFATRPYMVRTSEERWVLMDQQAAKKTWAAKAE